MRKFVSEGKTHNGSDIQIIVDDATDDITITLGSPDGIVTKTKIDGNNATDKAIQVVLDRVAKYSERECLQIRVDDEQLSQPYGIFTAAHVYDLKDVIEGVWFESMRRNYTAALRAKAKLDGLEGKRRVLSAALASTDKRANRQFLDEMKQLMFNISQALDLDEQYEIRSDFKELHSSVAPNTTSKLAHEIFREHRDKVDSSGKGGA